MPIINSPFPQVWQQTTGDYVTEPTRQEGVMWIECEGATKRIVDLAKLDTIEVRYRGSCKHAIVGTIGDRDVHLFTKENAREAADTVDSILKMLMS